MLSFEKSRALHEKSCQTLANGVSSGMRRGVTDPPLFFTHADGAYYHDVDGNCLLDYTLAWGPLILGSNHPGLNTAVTEAVTRSYTLGAQHEGEIALTEKIAAAVPGVEQVILSNTGSEAVQAAFRLARAATGRNKVVKFEGHYHGWFNNVLVSYHPSPEQLGTAAPTCGGQPASEFAETIALPWNDLDALASCFAAHPGEIACVITEPLLANSGCCEPHDGYLAGLITLCREHGAWSIFDEVITGFRLALGGAREYYGLEPDLSTYGKALAAGFSLSAVGGRRDRFDVLRDGRTIHAGTYNGATVNLAAAAATLDGLAAPGVYDRMLAHGEAIREHITAAAAREGLTMVTTGAGSVFGVHFGITEPPRNYTDTVAIDADAYVRFRSAMLHNGVQLLPDGRWYVGAAHSDLELARVCEAIDASITAAQ
jgi:glutamate-1-semialdehyde 2,1-aminomutase